MIFNVCMWSFLCVHIYIIYTAGLGTPTVSLHNSFYSEKLQGFLCSWRGFKLESWNPLGLESEAHPMEPPCHHRSIQGFSCTLIITMSSSWAPPQQGRPSERACPRSQILLDSFECQIQGSNLDPLSRRFTSFPLLSFFPLLHVSVVTGCVNWIINIIIIVGLNGGNWIINIIIIVGGG